MTSAGLQGQNVGSARVEEDEAPLEGIVDPRGNIGGVSLMTDVRALPTNAAGIWCSQVSLFQVGPAAPPSALPELFSQVIFFFLWNRGICISVAWFLGAPDKDFQKECPAVQNKDS